jgi:hypothetical protein
LVVSSCADSPPAEEEVQLQFFWPIVVSTFALLPSATKDALLSDRPAMRPSVEVLLPGDRLIQTLNDPKESLSKRLNAATELGRMKYAPAIPHLLKHLTLRDPDAGLRQIISLEDLQSGTVRLPGDGPCAQALLNFGREVTGPAVKMYVAPTTTDFQRRLLATVLRTYNSQRAREQTLEYVRTFGRDIKDQSERDRLIELYRLLHYRKDEFYVPDAWPRFDSRPPTGVGPGRPLDHVTDRLKSSG